MNSQNLFEKYGIKEVADVTFYRIEKKEEVYESQRSISASSILKGALELHDVYPINNGVGDEEGFQAYVFTDATLTRGTNYDCDDSQELSVKIRVTYTESNSSAEIDNSQLTTSVKQKIEENFDDIFKAKFGDGVMPAGFSADYGFAIDTRTGIPYSADKIEELLELNDVTISVSNTNAELLGEPKSQKVVNESVVTYNTIGTFLINANVSIVNNTEKSTGVFDNVGSAKPDVNRKVGTHEYTYAEQVCMLFAKRQNIISKTGVRYVFENANEIFGNMTFNDNFAAAPFSTEQIVVVGLKDKFDEGTYDLDEVNEAISQLKDSIEAKAYDVVYNDYAELVVEDEMGYYNPKFLGKDYKRIQGVGSITFFDEGGYKEYVGKDKVDNAIEDAVMWGDGVHYSINDAIDALRQKKLILDASEENGVAGINSIFGGYKVSSNETPDAGREDVVADGYTENIYSYKINKENSLVEATDKNGNTVTSEYPLTSVMDAVVDIGRSSAAFEKDLRVDTSGKTSNRATYIRVNGSVDIGAGAYIYLLKNKNSKKLSLDKEGIFKFNDKKGNVLYYQDKIFKGVEYLALVILGDKGLIFVVNRHGTKNVSKVAWMVNKKGYVNDSQAKTLVANGLIHTTDVTVNNETFEATCTVGSLKTHKTKKNTNRYVPVLFLDTLKVSTLEQTAEEVYAQGGRGNADLLGWDYGKEITLTLQDALFTPASMSAMLGSYEGSDFRNGVKEAKTIDRMEKVTAKRNFIVPAGNQNGTPTEADKNAQAIFIDPNTMEPYQDGTPIAEGEVFLKWTRSVAYEGQSIGTMIEISADKFPGTYKIVGDTYIKSKETGEDQRFQFIIPQTKMSSGQTITLEASGDPSVFDMSLKVLRPNDGVMMRLVQYNVVENKEENDGSTMVKGTENLNLLDDAELFKITSETIDEETFIGATEY